MTRSRLSRSIPRARRRLGAVAVTALLIAGCGDAMQMPPRIGDDLPEFSAELRSGETMAFADLQGGPALVNLWATWCPPCRSETPYLQHLEDVLGPHGLRVVGVTVDNTRARDAVDEFLASVGADYPQMLDPRMETMDLFGVIGLPATFVVDAEGAVTYFDMGPVDDDDPKFLAALQALVPAEVQVPTAAEFEAGEGDR